jgi:hypothetical protein
VEELKARHPDYQNYDQRLWLGHVFVCAADGQLNLLAWYVRPLASIYYGSPLRQP